MKFNKRQKIALLVMWVIIGVTSGAWISQSLSGSFQTPQAIEHPWRVISPMYEKDFSKEEIGRGIHIVDGALTITQHVLYPSDTLISNTERPIAMVKVELAPDSDTLMVVLGGGEKRFVFFEPGRVRPSPGDEWIETNTDVFTLMIRDEMLILKDTKWQFPIGPAVPGPLEMVTAGEQSRIARIGLYAENDVLINTMDYTDTGKSDSTLVMGLVIGALLGLCSGIFFCTGLRLYTPIVIAFMWVLPIGVCAIPRIDWLYAVEAFYLSKTPAWELSNIALVLSLLPTFAIGILSSGILSLHRFKRRAKKKTHQITLLLWTVSSVSALFYGYEDGYSLIAIVPMTVFMFMPIYVMLRSQFRQPAWLIFDFISLAFIGFWGWKGGLLLATLWRFLILLAASRALLKWGKRSAADYLFVLMIVLPISMELAIRNTYLMRAWDPMQLGLEYAKDNDLKHHKAEWKGKCGDLYPDTLHRIAYTGGSSTGGAFQFADEPQAFFAPQNHKLICNRLKDGYRLETLNFAQADFNTFTISKTFQSILDTSPNLIVLYIGVNDILNLRYKKSRRERELEKEKRNSALNSLSGFARRSRLVSFGSLLLNKSQEDTSKNVPEVSVEDARENLEDIANQIKDKSELLLLTELIISDQKPEMMTYQKMQMEFAETHPHVHYFDVRRDISDDEVNSLLADRNHLSREGNKKLAQILVEPIVDVLKLPLRDQDVIDSTPKPVEKTLETQVKADNKSVFQPMPNMIVEPSVNKVIVQQSTAADAKTFIANYVACDTVESYLTFKDAMMEGDELTMNQIKSLYCIDPNPGTRAIVKAKQATYVEVEFNYNGKTIQKWTEESALR